jgi:hypothetical protein
VDVENARELIAEGQVGARLTAQLCPRCGEPQGELPPVTAAALGGRHVVRCARCGTRSSQDESQTTLVFTCESCGLPFVADDLLPHADQLCPDCSSGSLPSNLPSRAVAQATESEIRAALASSWRFVASAPLNTYLDRIARQLARWIEAAPESSHVILVDDPCQRTLALPSGALLVSLGTLACLEDESELAFVLGHEIAHAASGDAAVRLVRLGFRNVASTRDGPDREAWAAAALDLVRLGYGRRRERDADLRALQALLTLHYDPESVLRYLARVRALVDRGEPTVAELASAHPPTGDRIRRIEKALYGRVAADTDLKVNRDVFRRAAGPEALASRMAGISIVEHAAKVETGGDKASSRGLRRWLWAGGIVLAGALALATLWALFL